MTLHDDIPEVDCRECGQALSAKDRKYCSRTCAARHRSSQRHSAEAFWARVEKHQSPDGCWLWIGSLTAAGYGHLRRPQGRYDYAHRVAYELMNGSIPDGLVIDHLCRVRSCCNPDHLQAVTHAENVRRGLVPYGVIRTTCRHGHDITQPENVYVAPKGDRRCRACASLREASR